MTTRYVRGQWRACCDRCGFVFYNTQLRKEWNGLMTCHGAGTTGCWEPRHPLDTAKAFADKQSVPWVRPDDAGAERFCDPNEPPDWSKF